MQTLQIRDTNLRGQTSLQNVRYTTAVVTNTPQENTLTHSHAASVKLRQPRDDTPVGKSTKGLAVTIGHSPKMHLALCCYSQLEACDL